MVVSSPAWVETDSHEYVPPGPVLVAVIENWLPAPVTTLVLSTETLGCWIVTVTVVWRFAPSAAVTVVVPAAHGIV